MPANRRRHINALPAIKLVDLILSMKRGLAIISIMFAACYAAVPFSFQKRVDGVGLATMANFKLDRAIERLDGHESRIERLEGAPARPPI